MHNIQSKWNKSINLFLSRIRNEIVRRFVPLAIDIKGLTEVKNEKRLFYLKEIYQQAPPNFHKQILVDFWGMLAVNTNEFKGITYSERVMNIRSKQKSYQEYLSELTDISLKFEDYFSNSSLHRKVDIGLTQDFKKYDEQSPLVKLMIDLENCNDENMKEFPKDLLKYLDFRRGKFWFPSWLQKLDEQFSKIHNKLISQ